MIKYYFVALLLVIGNSSFAQLSDTLNAVKVHGSHKDKTLNDLRVKDFTPGQKRMSIDSTTLQQYQLQNVSTLLSQQSSVFIKSYGFNTLATLGLRGASAAQSQVLWNGVPIQNAALGTADISELPVMFMNKVSILYGSSAALTGSGNVGGTLLLENDLPVFDSVVHKHLSASVGMGSFAQQMAGIKMSLNTKRWFFAINALAQSAENNFEYVDDYKVAQQMSNSHLQSGALLLQTAYKLSHTDVLSFYCWYQKYDRQIPPALFENSSEKQQNDKSLKLLLEWRRHLKKDEWYMKNSFIHDDIQYYDAANKISTGNPVSQYYLEVGWEHIINENRKLLLLYPIQISFTDYHNTVKQQFKAGVVVAYDMKGLRQKLDIALNAREESINSKAVFAPGVNASYQFTNWLQFKGNVQYTYRAPNLNELYYFPGGNPDLQAEEGLNEDAGWRLNFDINDHISFRQDVSVFNRDINNWIVWFGGNIWTPHNIAEVNSRGVETENLLRYKVSKDWKLYIGLNTSYVIATTAASDALNDGSIGKQIPYTPRYNGVLNMGFDYRSLHVNYSQTYTGYRFITVDESEYIEPYTVGNVQLSYGFQWNRHSFLLNGQVNNIWNEHYQVVAYRPMPGINWLLGFRMNLQ